MPLKSQSYRETLYGRFEDVIEWQILPRAPYKLSRAKDPVWGRESPV